MGGGDSESKQETSGWQPALDAGQGIINQAGSIADQMMGTQLPSLSQTGTNSNLAGAWGQMGGSGMNDLAQQMGQYGNQMMGNIGQLGGLYEEIGKGPNMYNQQNNLSTLMAGKEAYLEDMNSSTMNALNKAVATQTGQLYGQAAGGGNVGSSRTQLSVGQAAGDLASQAQSTMANIYSSSYDTAAQQAMQMEQDRINALQSQAAGIAGMGQMGSSMMGQAGDIYNTSMQNQLNAGLSQAELEQMNNLIAYQNAMGQYNKPMDILSWQNSMVNPWMGASQTTTTTGPGADTMGQLIGAGGTIIGGLGAGGFFGGSDKKLKDNITIVGKDDNGLNVYTWEWNEVAQELMEQGYGDYFGAPKGYIAQEVQEIYPEYVIETEGGFLAINYAALAVEGDTDE